MATDTVDGHAANLKSVAERGWDVSCGEAEYEKRSCDDEGFETVRRETVFIVVCESERGEKYVYCDVFYTHDAARNLVVSAIRGIARGATPIGSKKWSSAAARYGSRAWQEGCYEQREIEDEREEARLYG